MIEFVKMIELVKSIQTIVLTVVGAILGATVSAILVLLCGVQPSLLLLLPPLLLGLAAYLFYTRYVVKQIDSFVDSLKEDLDI